MKEPWGLSQNQKRVLEVFKETKESKEFYLTGGTALSAFYLQHRISKDFDFFTAQDNLVSPFSKDLTNRLGRFGFKVKPTRQLESFSEILITDTDFQDKPNLVVVHLAKDSPFRFKQAEELYPGLKVDSLIDIGANKILTIFGRADLRDFVDVYFLTAVEKCFEFDDLVEKARKKDPGCDYYWLSASLKEIEKFSSGSLASLMLKKELDFESMEDFFIQKAYLLLEKVKQ